MKYVTDFILPHVTYQQASLVISNVTCVLQKDSSQNKGEREKPPPLMD